MRDKFYIIVNILMSTFSTLKWFTGVFFIIIFSSCYEQLPPHIFNGEQLPVVNGILKPDSLFKVHVSLTTELSDKSPRHVDNAIVTISNNDNMIIDTLHYQSDGWYVGSQYAEIDSLYLCTVEVPDFPRITAYARIPQPSKIESIDIRKTYSFENNGATISLISFIIRNEKSEQIFRECNLVVKGYNGPLLPPGFSYGSFPRKYLIPTISLGLDPVLMNESEPMNLLSNHNMDSVYQWNIGINNLHHRYSRRDYKKDTLILEVKTVDHSYYLYKKRYFLYESANLPALGKSPQRYSLYSNVKNGLGLFTAESSTQIDITDIANEKYYE